MSTTNDRPILKVGWVPIAIVLLILLFAIPAIPIGTFFVGMILQEKNIFGGRIVCDRTQRNASILRMQLSGRWAVCRPGREPVEITSGELFRIEVAGKLVVTRMEYADDGHGGGRYYSVDGYELRDGMRAAIGGGK